MMLDDATDEHLIPANPLHHRRHRGRRTLARRSEPVVATPRQVIDIAEQARLLGGDTAATLIITAAYTGARWGELTGLQRTNTHLNDGHITIDPDIGALHEINGALSLGPPKTAESARTITLPDFLINLLHQHLTPTTTHSSSPHPTAIRSDAATSTAASCAHPATAPPNQTPH
ncbi:hypothetical protein [Saccharopolyspora antimicrobica]|nr:hypothetical protein [Saccharopolyspora antimicrobica]